MHLHPLYNFLLFTFYLRITHYVMRGLGFFPFARRYLGNTYLSLLLLVLRCFTSQGTLSNHKDLSYPI